MKPHHQKLMEDINEILYVDLPSRPTHFTGLATRYEYHVTAVPTTWKRRLAEWLRALADRID